MINVGDFVEVVYGNSEEKLMGEVMAVADHKLELFVIFASDKLSRYQNEFVEIDQTAQEDVHFVKIGENRLTYQTKNEILSLIDLTLDLNDRQWFMLLTYQLKQWNEQQRLTNV